MVGKKKKILFSAYSLDLGGIETALVTLINYLSKVDYDVTLVLEKKQGMFLEKIDRNIKIIEYSPSYSKIKILSKCINICKRMKFYLKYKNKFDFACSYATYCQMASVVARIASNNNLLWVHNNYYDFFDKNEWKYKEFFNSIESHKFKNIIFVSNEAKEQYVEKYDAKNEKLFVCNNLIDFENIYKLSNEKIELQKEDNITTFLYVGRHDEHQKRVTRLIDAAKKLDKDNENFRIILVGDGESTNYYKKIVKEYNLNDRIIFVGKTKNPYPYFKISDCVILTSEFEGYPVVYVEAKVLEKPIITTDVSDSIMDINNKCGVVTSKDDEEIYKAMKNFIKNGFNIKEKFNPQKYNEEIIKIIENIIEK